MKDNIRVSEIDNDPKLICLKILFREFHEC